MNDFEVEYRQARAFRRFFMTRLAVIIAGAWLLSWPVHLLPHTLFWTLLATAALVIGLTSPPRTHPASSDRPSTPQR
jgi:O-antigen ligase